MRGCGSAVVGEGTHGGGISDSLVNLLVNLLVTR